MGFIRAIITRHKEKVKTRNDICNNLISQIETALYKIDELFIDIQAFIEPEKETEWKNSYSDLMKAVEIQNIQKLKKAHNFSKLLEQQKKLYFNADSFKQQISTHNDRAANAKIQDTCMLLGDVEGRKLDRQQLLCIIKDVHSQLVIAGAGTGKTTTVVGKVKFLLKSGKCRPEDILVLSFTNASASEMSQRIAKETGENISASTFHKLGINIITSVDGIVPRITKLNVRKFVKEQLLLNMQSEKYMALLGFYLLYNRVVYKSEFEFKSEDDYEEYLQLNPPITINGESVKSYGEMDIANFLMQNGIKYIYEQPYKVDTRTSEYGQYNPDFYLPDYDIYIEYFGINKNGEVPAYFKAANGMTATEAYQAAIKWKREIHSMNNTVMIECYAYEKSDGVLLKNL